MRLSTILVIAWLVALGVAMPLTLYGLQVRHPLAMWFTCTAFHLCLEEP